MVVTPMQPPQAENIEGDEEEEAADQPVVSAARVIGPENLANPYRSNPHLIDRCISTPSRACKRSKAERQMACWMYACTCDPTLYDQALTCDPTDSKCDPTDFECDPRITCVTLRM